MQNLNKYSWGVEPSEVEKREADNIKFWGGCGKNQKQDSGVPSPTPMDID